MSDALVGVVGEDFVMIMADTAASRSVVQFKDDEDKIMLLDKFKLLGTAGAVGDRVQFSEYVQKNIHLYNLRNAMPLSTHAAANFIRLQLAEALRRNPYQVDMLLGGYDEKAGPSLYFMDYMASMHPVSKAAHGYASYFVSSILDRHWKEGLTIDEAKEILRKCAAELTKRFLLKLPKFIVKVVDKDGCRQVSLDV